MERKDIRFEHEPRERISDNRYVHQMWDEDENENTTDVGDDRFWNTSTRHFRFF